MSRNGRLRTLVMLIALTVTAAIPVVGQHSASAQPPPGPDGDPVMTTEEAFTAMAEDYAEMFGVTVTEAKRRLELQALAGKLNEQLMINERAFLGGVRIEHLPEFRVVVSVTPGGEARVRKYTEDGPLKDVAHVETVRWTLDQLTAHQTRADKLAQQVGIKTASGVLNQTVVLSVADATLLDARMRAASLLFPETVEVVEEELPSETYELLGGWGVRVGGQGCTSGFTGYNSAGVGGVFTAGHCGGLGSDTMTFDFDPSQSLAFGWEYYGGPYDWQFQRNTTTHRLRNMINTGDTWRPITGLYWRIWQVQGTVVCKFGKTTYLGCGTIVTNGFDPDGAGNQTATYVRVERAGVDLSEGGDSGGPFFGGQSSTINSAFGIMKGQIGFEAYYMTIDYVYNQNYGFYTNCGSDYICP